MWGINPNLSYRIPMTFDFMFEKLSTKDYIVGGSGGAGYIIPEALFHDKTLAYMGEKRPESNADAGTVWANYCKTFYNRFGIEMTGFIINGAQHNMTENIASAVSAYSPKLNFTNCHNTPIVKQNGTYFVYCHNGIDVNQSDVMYNHAVSTMNSGINFSAYRTVCVSPSNHYKIVNEFNSYAASKGLTAKYVDPYTYYNVLKASGQGKYAKVTKTLLASFDTVTNVTTEFSTVAANETNNKTEGTGTLHLSFQNVTGESAGSKIGGMAYYNFGNAVNLSSYDEITFDYWFSDAVTGSAMLQVNFVTNGKDDGFNYNIHLDGTQPGWHTATLIKNSPTATANNPDWSSIKYIRFTYFNYSDATSPNFIMIDNMNGVTYG